MNLYTITCYQCGGVVETGFVIGSRIYHECCLHKDDVPIIDAIKLADYAKRARLAIDVADACIRYEDALCDPALTDAAHWLCERTDRVHAYRAHVEKRDE